MIGRNQNFGQNPGAPGSLYPVVELSPAELPSAIIPGQFPLVPAPPVMARSLGQSPRNQVRIVMGAEGFGTGLFTHNVNLNELANIPQRVLVPAEFNDRQTNTRR